MSPEQRALYQEVLTVKITKEQIMAKIKSNNDDTLRKFHQRLFPKANIDGMPTQRILESISTFLATNEGKLQGALKMNLENYKKTYLVNPVPKKVEKLNEVTS